MGLMKQTSKEKFHIWSQTIPMAKMEQQHLCSVTAHLAGICHPQGSYLRAAAQRFFTLLTSRKVSRNHTAAKLTPPLPVPGFPPLSWRCIQLLFKMHKSRNICHWAMSEMAWAKSEVVVSFQFFIFFRNLLLEFSIIPTPVELPSIAQFYFPASQKVLVGEKDPTVGRYCVIPPVQGKVGADSEHSMIKTQV